MEQDWDLHAVVRGRRAQPAAGDGTPSCSSSDAAPSPAGEGFDPSLLSFPESSSGKTALQELLELCEPFLRRGKPAAPRHRAPLPAGRSKRRKSQLKKVTCLVPAEALAADVWAWRKYGQKPIKGSPFPRGYYRCSSSKGCPARKQVERSRTDSGMFLITFMAEHNHPAPTHRNSLAGSTRIKAPPHPAIPTTEEEEEEEEEEEDSMLMVSDMEVLGDDEIMFGGSPDFFCSSNSLAADEDR